MTMTCNEYTDLIIELAKKENKVSYNIGNELAARKLFIVYDYANDVKKHVYTAVYKKISRDAVEIATACCHKNDLFTKKEGARAAIDNWDAGKTIRLPLKTPINEFGSYIRHNIFGF